MPYKEFNLTNTQKIKIYKRHGSKNIRLSINNQNQVKVSIPYWAPYISGLKFAYSKIDWILKQVKKPQVLSHNQNIGKAHKLVFQPSISQNLLTYKIESNYITVKHPINRNFMDLQVQQKAQTAAIQGLRLQAERLLPQRLNQLSLRFNLPYKDMKVKKLTSRWGSCDINKRIVLNLYLMNLPWSLIDYVILHELTHTKVLKHGPSFWAEISKLCPNYKLLKKELKKYQPSIIGL
ncbi:MAG TPA: YgjP-like metallopeptidase domain-containing protein [Patescibacteria group bacterium]|nr:YgjP-like metallopeptidase domain-containing protein [Patescibacteria group bacterium]